VRRFTASTNRRAHTPITERTHHERRDRLVVSSVAGVATNRESAALIETLVQLGRSLHIQTLAESIEDHEQLRALQSADCDLGQGFLLSRPLPAEAADRLLARRAPARLAYAY
jgi:EAL domain-containing protein (putative c-di-GMP-specific phosphodiesterase class I)